MGQTNKQKRRKRKENRKQKRRKEKRKGEETILHSFIEHHLRTYYVPGTVLDSRKTSANRQPSLRVLMGLTFYRGKTGNNKISTLYRML